MDKFNTLSIQIIRQQPNISNQTVQKTFNAEFRWERNYSWMDKENFSLVKLICNEKSAQRDANTARWL